MGMVSMVIWGVGYESKRNWLGAWKRVGTERQAARNNRPGPDLFHPSSTPRLPRAPN